MVAAVDRPHPRRRRQARRRLQARGDRPRRAPARPTTQLLRRARSGSTQSDEEIAPYRYGPPASPHLAAELAGEEIDPERLLDAPPEPRRQAPTRSSARASAACSCPLAPDYLVRDLAVDLGLPLVIAASPGLGTINHTLLTIEAARAAGLEVAAVVLTPWPEEPSRDRRVQPRDDRRPRRGSGRDAASPDLSEPQRWPPLRTKGLIRPPQPSPRHPGSPRPRPPRR